MKRVIFALVLFSLVLLMAEITYPVVDTGQTLSYNNQNGNYCTGSWRSFLWSGCELSGNQPDYTDNGDGTVTDNCTSLMWKLCSEPDTATATCAARIQHTPGKTPWHGARDWIMVGILIGDYPMRKNYGV